MQGYWTLFAQMLYLWVMVAQFKNAITENVIKRRILPNLGYTKVIRVYLNIKNLI
jgi:hypothetical protein